MAERQSSEPFTTPTHHINFNRIYKKNPRHTAFFFTTIIPAEVRVNCSINQQNKKVIIEIGFGSFHRFFSFVLIGNARRRNLHTAQKTEKKGTDSRGRSIFYGNLSADALKRRNMFMNSLNFNNLNWLQCDGWGRNDFGATKSASLEIPCLSLVFVLARFFVKSFRQHWETVYKSERWREGGTWEVHLHRMWRASQTIMDGIYGVATARLERLVESYWMVVSAVRHEGEVPASYQTTLQWFLFYVHVPTNMSGKGKVSGKSVGSRWGAGVHKIVFLKYY